MADAPGQDPREEVYLLAALLSDIDRVLHPLPRGMSGLVRTETIFPPSLPSSEGPAGAPGRRGGGGPAGGNRGAAAGPNGIVAPRTGADMGSPGVGAGPVKGFSPTSAGKGSSAALDSGERSSFPTGSSAGGDQTRQPPSAGTGLAGLLRGLRLEPPAKQHLDAGPDAGSTPPSPFPLPGDEGESGRWTGADAPEPNPDIGHEAPHGGPTEASAPAGIRALPGQPFPHPPTAGPEPQPRPIIETASPEREVSTREAAEAEPPEGLPSAVTGPIPQRFGPPEPATDGGARPQPPAGPAGGEPLPPTGGDTPRPSVETAPPADADAATPHRNRPDAGGEAEPYPPTQTTPPTPDALLSPIRLRRPPASPAPTFDNGAVATPGVPLGTAPGFPGQPPPVRDPGIWIATEAHKLPPLQGALVPSENPAPDLAEPPILETKRFGREAAESGESPDAVWLEPEPGDWWEPTGPVWSPSFLRLSHRQLHLTRGEVRRIDQRLRSGFLDRALLRLR